MFGSIEVLVLTILFWLVSVWVFYMLIKAAVRNGILEADDIRAGRRRGRTLPDLQARVEDARRDAGDHTP